MALKIRLWIVNKNWFLELLFSLHQKDQILNLLICEWYVCLYICLTNLSDYDWFEKYSHWRKKNGVLYFDRQSWRQMNA